jgi:hypothetical protein
VTMHNGDRWEDRDLFEKEDASENEEDVKVKPEHFSNISIAPSDWTVGSLYGLLGKQIDLDPAYQRRSVWSAHAKSQFIESLMLGIPIPQILLASRTSKKNEFLVLDGKQRLTAIKEFLDGFHSDGKEFRLRNLSLLGEALNNKSWGDIANTEWADRLLNEPIRTTVLRGWDSEAVLYQIFYRLNSGSVKLSPMELRMSLHPGDFLRFIVKWTESIGPLHELLRKKQPDPRMGDVELAIRYLAFRTQETAYRGELKDFLDECCTELNEKFRKENWQPTTEGDLHELNEAIVAGFRIFGERQFCRKYTENRYELLFNRAIFDVMVGSLSVIEFREWALNNHDAVVKKYIDVSTNDTRFTRAVETSTKSVEATRDRFTIWYDAVLQISGIKLDIPNIRA